MVHVEKLYKMNCIYKKNLHMQIRFTHLMCKRQTTRLERYTHKFILAYSIRDKRPTRMGFALAQLSRLRAFENQAQRP